MKKDIKYIIKRVIIGILIGLFFLMYKSKISFAATIDTVVTANSYYQTQYCEVGDSITGTFNNSIYTGNRFNCTKGPSYKFSQYLNSTENVAVPVLINSGQLFNNFTFEITFEQLQIITTTDRYIELRAPWVSSYTSSPRTLGVNSNYLTLNGIVDNTTKNYTPSVSTFFNQPQYCSWVDNTGSVSSCNVHIAADSSISRYTYYIDIPVGSAVRTITLYFGNSNIQDTYDIYSNMIPATSRLFRAMTTTLFGYYNSNCSSTTSSYDCYSISYSNLKDQNNSKYNIYGEHFFSGAGLIYYYYPPDTPTFTPSSTSPNIWFSNSLASDNITYNFSAVTDAYKGYYDNLVGNIENEVNPQPSNDSFFNDFLEGFQASSQASGFLSLFNNMFIYPMQKLQTNAQVDLVRTNINGGKVLNNYLCMKNSETGMVGEYVPYNIQFYRDYQFSLPCPHTDIYDKLYYGEYGFYGNDFKGASVHSGITYSFVDIWLTIQHGFLVYILFVNCLNIYKYVLDSNKTEIEVLEL